MGEDADLEKTGRILNRVIMWSPYGITIEADQRIIREMFEGCRIGTSESHSDSMQLGREESEQCRK